MVKSLFYALLICAPLFLGMSTSFADYRLDHQRYVQLNLDQKKKIVIEIMKVVAEMESRSRYEKNDEKLKKFTLLLHKLQNLVIAEASADAAARSRASLVQFTELLKQPDRCLYSGYISQLNGQGKCTHLVNLTKASPERKAYQAGCREPSQISCNPLIFGYKKIADSTPFCVPAGPMKDAAHNASVSCMKKALAENNEGDSKEKRLEFLAKQLSEDKALAKELFDFIAKACVCDPGPKNLNAGYHKYMQPHRTCYGLMNMIAEVTAKCEQQVIDDNSLKLFQDLKTKIQNDPVIDPKTFDSQYSGFLIEIGESQEFKGLCGVSNSSTSQEQNSNSGKDQGINLGGTHNGVVTNDAINNGTNNTTSTNKPINGEGTSGGATAGSTGNSTSGAAGGSSAGSTDGTNAVVTAGSSGGSTAGASGGASAGSSTAGVSGGTSAGTSTSGVSGGESASSSTAGVSGGASAGASGGSSGGLVVTDSKPTPPDSGNNNPTNSTQNGGGSNNPTGGTQSGSDAAKPAETQSNTPTTKESSSQFTLSLEAKDSDKTVDIKASSSPAAPAGVTLVWYILNKNGAEVAEPKAINEDQKPAPGTAIVDTTLKVVKHDASEPNTKPVNLTGWNVQVTKTTAEYEICAKLVSGETVVSNTACKKIEKEATSAQSNSDVALSITVKVVSTAAKNVTVEATTTKDLPEGYTIYWFTKTSEQDPAKGSKSVGTIVVPGEEASTEEEKLTVEQLEQNGAKPLNKDEAKITVDRKKEDQQVCAVLVNDNKVDSSISSCAKVPKLEEAKSKPAGNGTGGPFFPGMMNPGLVPSRTGGDVILRGVR